MLNLYNPDANGLNCSVVRFYRRISAVCLNWFT